MHLNDFVLVKKEQCQMLGWYCIGNCGAIYNKTGNKLKVCVALLYVIGKNGNMCPEEEYCLS